MCRITVEPRSGRLPGRPTTRIGKASPSLKMRSWCVSACRLVVSSTWVPFHAAADAAVAAAAAAVAAASLLGVGRLRHRSRRRRSGAQRERVARTSEGKRLYGPLLPLAGWLAAWLTDWRAGSVGSRNPTITNRLLHGSGGSGKYTPNCNLPPRITKSKA